MAAVGAQGTILQRGAGTVGEVTGISGPNFRMAPVESTALSDTWKEFVATVLDGGEFTVDINYDPADGQQNALLQTDFATKALTTFSIQWSDAGTTTWTFTAFVTGYAMSAASADDKLSASVTFQISGAVTLS